MKKSSPNLVGQPKTAVVLDLTCVDSATAVAKYLQNTIVKSSRKIVTTSSDVWERYCDSRYKQFANCQ